MSKDHFIALFDSGLGGLTVLNRLKKELPSERFLYFGDTARVPYGNKSKETILRYSREILHFFLSFPVKMIVICCNTASVFAAKELREEFSLPLFDVIEPAIEQAVSVTTNGKLGLIGTKSTIQSGVYQQLIASKDKKIHLFAKACPLFVPLIEEGLANHPAMELFIKDYLGQMQMNQIDTLILACTHYPLIKEKLHFCLGEDVQMIDSGQFLAKRIKDYLKKKQLLHEFESAGEDLYFVTDDPHSFEEKARFFMPAMKIKAKMIALKELTETKALSF